jgi:hypothetical protein
MSLTLAPRIKITYQIIIILLGTGNRADAFIFVPCLNLRKDRGLLGLC